MTLISLRVIHTLASVAQESMSPETIAHLLFPFASTGLNMSASSLRALEELATALVERAQRVLFAKNLLIRGDLINEVSRGNEPQIAAPAADIGNRHGSLPQMALVPVDDAPRDDVAQMQLASPAPPVQAQNVDNENPLGNLPPLQPPPDDFDNVEMLGDDLFGDIFDWFMSEDDDEDMPAQLWPRHLATPCFLTPHLIRPAFTYSPGSHFLLCLCSCALL